MKGAPHPEKLRPSVSRASTEITTNLQTGMDDLMLCFACQTYAPDELQILFQQHFKELAV